MSMGYDLHLILPLTPADEDVLSAHRALITRKLKGLEDAVTFTSVHWHMDESGWRFATAQDRVSGENTLQDPTHPQFTRLRDLYLSIDPEYNGRVSVSVLYDTKTKQIVNNEAGFATTQAAYEKAMWALFSSLDRIEIHLAYKESGSTPFFFGSNVTETDIRLYTTLIRFDPVYVQHFKTNIRDICSGYPTFRETTEFEHIKKHYTKSHPQLNQFQITSLGPLPDILPKDEEVRSVAAVADLR
ncbi:hypothetical protein N7532_001232 [Penicillium argentinense]|uniref:GST C-terminal domain-containing protein n=1 Tax=Penicillium argentinense TaxID=1131581 RepID=A0A9W9G270_9EURO|nr:uncharacterized protein N7532_001232 [Penicillium argentinense]KAJ5110697.1 hypothetical protein N7532_001232 [Penicillium argentinense]